MPSQHMMMRFEESLLGRRKRYRISIPSFGRAPTDTQFEVDRKWVESHEYDNGFWGGTKTGRPFKGQFSSEGYSGATDDYFECLSAVSTDRDDVTGREIWTFEPEESKPGPEFCANKSHQPPSDKLSNSSLSTINFGIARHFRFQKKIRVVDLTFDHENSHILILGIGNIGDLRDPSIKLFGGICVSLQTHVKTDLYVPNFLFRDWNFGQYLSCVCHLADHIPLFQVGFFLLLKKMRCNDAIDRASDRRISALGFE